ncbi:hypothetical protein KR059_010270 [Drosophila kikkawai]|nr:hypothetical protein KR059_010270 [Drosophila kikkawai]
MLLHESAASMEQSMPENLSTQMCEVKVPAPTANCTVSERSDRGLPAEELAPRTDTGPASTSPPATTSTTKVKLSFSVDRLLGSSESSPSSSPASWACCDGNAFSCCTFPRCFSQAKAEVPKLGQLLHPAAAPATASHLYSYVGLDKLYPGMCMDYKSVLRPTPIRAAEHATSTYPTLATNALLRFHQHHQQHHQQHLHQQHKPPPHSSTIAASGLLAPLHSLKNLQCTQQQRFLGKSQQQLLDHTTTTPADATPQNGSHGNNGCNGGGNNGKRKRSWSRAVFTNLQRKGLEIQFQQQKYITKPDRRKLAARLNLTDAQVKVWFQNRRMKWRHTRENLKSGQEKQPQQHQQPTSAGVVSGGSKGASVPGAGNAREALDYSSDSSSSVALSEQADDDDDNIVIDVVE